MTGKALVVKFWSALTDVLYLAAMGSPAFLTDAALRAAQWAESWYYGCLKRWSLVEVIHVDLDGAYRLIALVEHPNAARFQHVLDLSIVHPQPNEAPWRSYLDCPETWFRKAVFQGLEKPTGTVVSLRPAASAVGPFCVN